MKHSGCSLGLYTNFLVANQNRYSGLECSKVLNTVSHDTISRWLADATFTPSDLWRHVKDRIDPTTGYLVGDDSLLDKQYSRKNELARKQYSGNEHGIVNGICLVNLLWTSGKEYVPVDYRIYQKTNDDRTKNDHFQDMLKRAKHRGFMPLFVLMDAWYSSVENLKLITGQFTWHFMCNLKSNRKISVTKGVYIPISALRLANKQVRKVWLKEYGHIMVCKTVDKNGDVTYLATDDLALTDCDVFIRHFKNRWKIEEFHRGIKQTTGIEKCYSTKASSQRTHIFAAFIAFLKLEDTRRSEDIPWYEQKAAICRMAAQAYLVACA